MPATRDTETMKPIPAGLMAPEGLSAPQESPVVSGLPVDVTKFKQRRDLCDHLRGEEPYDAERRKFLEENMNKNCAGTDKELESLKLKYKHNEAVLRVLAGYEIRIEGTK